MEGILDAIERMPKDKSEDWIENKLKSGDFNIDWGFLGWDQANGGLWAVLNRYTESTARSRVRNGDRGKGIVALYNLTKWFQRMTGASLVDKRARVMRLVQAQRESEVLARIERWRTEMRDLERMEQAMGEGSSMSEAVKKNAVGHILVGPIRVL